MKYFFRILALPFILCLHAISMIRLTIDYLRYGSELISHNKNTEKHVADIFTFLHEKTKS
jgi:hypothetical protein